MTKQQLLEKLGSSEELVKIAYVPVSEVIKWVNELEETNINLDMLTEEIIDGISDEGTDLIEDYELEMNYREVELTSISIDRDRVERIVNNVISTYKNN